MSPAYTGLFFLLYTTLIFIIARITSRKATNATYLTGNRTSPWFLVAYGMIGASLSGVTFMSVPGWVGESGFTYFMIVAGYMAGYAVIATVLLPLYYKLNLTSIYSYLKQRYGFFSQKTGALLFLVSRSVGSSLRMFLVIYVLHSFILHHFGVSFALSALIFILLILLYTYKGGIKTIVYTDTLQTTFMIASVVITFVMIAQRMDMSVTGLMTSITESHYFRIIETDWTSRHHWLKQFLSGMFITIVMTGLDQEMMQKNLTCRNLKDAQKNMFTFSGILLFVNLIFLFLGASLFLFIGHSGLEMPASTDQLFPMIALNVLGPVMAIVFVIGLISAAYSSADGTITSLTTSFIVDVLHIETRYGNEEKRKKVRLITHFSITAMLYLLILLFSLFRGKAVIDQVFTIAGYTYGPLLGLFAFGLFTKLNIREKFVPAVAVISPIICYFLSKYSETLFNGYKFGFELLIINGMLTFVMLLALVKKKPQKSATHLSGK
jgi:Na+/proline symporter